MERLIEMFCLFSFDEMFSVFSVEDGLVSGWLVLVMKYLVEGWIKYSVVVFNLEDEEGLLMVVLVSYFGIFELVGLLKNYDFLIEECMCRKCLIKGKDIMDLMICLFCGEIFCG